MRLRCLATPREREVAVTAAIYTCDYRDGCAVEVTWLRDRLAYRWTAALLPGDFEMRPGGVFVPRVAAIYFCPAHAEFGLAGAPSSLPLKVVAHYMEGQITRPVA